MKPTTEQLKIINSRLPEHSVSADDVEVLSFMVFDAEVTDRFTIMTPEMMNKLAQDLCEGAAAFNKLHNSREALPVGASVYGRVVEAENTKQLQAIMYAAVKKPDGTEFTPGKDIIDRYKMGAVRACSAGVRVGFYKCNICGNDIRNYEDCEHIPGRNYLVNEQPTVCYAYMTGRDIVDGMAMDCGIYEVSAVTAGGVANAGSMTETFGAYKDGIDPKEFKKSVVDDKDPGERLVFSVSPGPPPEGTDMEKKDVEQLIEERFSQHKQETEALATELSTQREEFNTLKAAKEEVDSNFTSLKAEFSSLETSKEEVDGALATVQEEFEAFKEATSAFQTAFAKQVHILSVKAGADVSEETFMTKTAEELIASVTEYEEIISALPTGEQTTPPNSGQEEFTFDDSFYKA